MISAEERKRRVAIPTYSLAEELISSISHGIGALFGIAALVLCIVKSCNPFDGFKLASSIVFGVTTVILYLMSCLYHALKVNRAKRVFRVFDHCTIFFLIAGTYTPFTLVTLRESMGWWLFGVIWLIAVVGVVLNAVSLKKFAKVSVACYLLMGWMVIFSFPQLKLLMDARGINLLLAGGCVYTLGAILYGIGSKKKFSILSFISFAWAAPFFISLPFIFMSFKERGECFNA